MRTLSKVVRRSFASPSNTGLVTMAMNVKTKNVMDVFLETKEGDVLIKEPVKMAIAALASCEVHTLAFNARKRNIKIEDVTFSNVSTVIDLDGFKGVEGHQPDFKVVNMEGNGEDSRR